MCTVSWRSRSDGYDLFFNRDELNTRASEIAPTVAETAGVKFIAPHDGEHGGTWLLVNEHGITICLLNDYGSPWRPDPTKPGFSRGHVVLAAADVTTIEEVGSRLEMQPLALTAPFHLLALSPGRDPLLLHWHGAGLARRRRAIVPAVLTSSSFATADVIAARLQVYLDRVRHPSQPQLTELASFHRQHNPAAGAYSVAMRRPDATTRSFIQVTVNRREISLNYERASWGGQRRASPIRHRLRRRFDSASLAA